MADLGLDVLGTGEGAGGALGQLLAQRRAEQLLQQQGLERVAALQQQGELAKQRLGEQAWRDQMLQFSRDQAAQAAREKEATRAQEKETGMLEGTFSPNQLVPIEQYQQQLKPKLTAEGQQLFGYQPPSLGISTPEGEQAPTPEAMRFKGTFGQLQKIKEGELKEAEAPLVQVMKNGIPTWVTRKEAIGQQAYEKPTKEPSEHFVQTPELDPKTGIPTGRYFGYNTTTNQFVPIGGPQPTGTKAPPGAAQAATKELGKQSGMTAVNRLESDIDEADQNGLLGPASGRFYDLMAKAGTTGNPKLDDIIGRIKGDLVLAKMHVDAGIGGARAAASPLLMNRWEDLAMRSSKALMKGYTGAMKADLGGGGATNAPKRIVYDINGKPVS